MNAGRAVPTRQAPRHGLGGSVAIVMLDALASACVPNSEPANDDVIETAHLRISDSTDNPICAGTPLLLESQLERIATTLELPLWSENDKLEVRLGRDAVAEVCTSWDSDEITGCVGRNDDDDRVVASTDVAYNAPHELVHAVRLKNDTWSTTAFEEGLAELLSASDGFPVHVTYPHGDPVVGPLELLEIPSEDFHVGYYVSAQDFLAWLWETHGRDTLMGYLDDPAFDGADTALPLFEQHYGLSLAEAEQGYRIDERPDPIWGAPCIPERTYSLLDGPVELSGDFDCSEPTVYGASHFMSLWPMCLDVPETSRVRISFEAEHGRFQVLSREPCDAGPAGAEAYRDKRLEAGDVLEEDIAGCRYRMLLFSQEPGFPATPYAIRIEETSG